jgi:hypothetical protein
MALALAPAAEPEEALEDTAMFLLEAAECLMVCGALRTGRRRRRRRRRAKKRIDRIDIIAVGVKFFVWWQMRKVSNEIVCR